MISLRKLWAAPEPGTGYEDLTRVVSLLIQGIAMHAVEGDPVEYQGFRQDLQQQLEAVQAGPPVAEILVSVGVILKTLEAYNARATRHLRMQGAELHHMIAMLTRTVASLGTGSHESVQRLRDIEGQLEKTSAIEDIRALKQRLGDCLDSIRNEAIRQKAESSQAVSRLQDEIRESQVRVAAAGAGPVKDPTTGLPARAAATSALAEWSLQPHPPLAALFVVDRVALINTRFGYAVGDKVLRAYLEQLEAKLSPSDQLFRWSGPSFLALMGGSNRVEDVRERLRFTLSGKIERNFELTNRTVMLPISAAWAVFELGRPLEDLIGELDAFLTVQSPGQYLPGLSPNPPSSTDRPHAAEPAPASGSHPAKDG